MDEDHSVAEESVQRRRGAAVAHTVLAIPAFFAAYLILGSLITIVWIVMVGSQMWVPEVVMASTGAVIGALTGLFLGSQAIEGLLPAANRKVVFVAFLLFALPSAVGMFVDSLSGGEYLPAAVGNIAGALMGYHVLWRGEKA